MLTFQQDSDPKHTVRQGNAGVTQGKLSESEPNQAPRDRWENSCHTVPISSPTWAWGMAECPQIQMSKAGDINSKKIEGRNYW